MPKISVIVLIALAAIVTTTSFAEEITLTTYYPAPYGVYREMRAQRMAIGASYYDASAYPWDTGGSLGTNEIPQGVDLVVEGQVGIGTNYDYGAYQLVVESDPVEDTYGLGGKANVWIMDSNSQAKGVGGGIALAGQYSPSKVGPFAMIWAEKEIASNWDVNGQLHLGTMNQGEGVGSDLSIDSDGNVIIEKTLTVRGGMATGTVNVGGNVTVSGTISARGGGIIYSCPDLAKTDPGGGCVGQLSSQATCQTCNDTGWGCDWGKRACTAVGRLVGQ